MLLESTQRLLVRFKKIFKKFLKSISSSTLFSYKIRAPLPHPSKSMKKIIFLLCLLFPFLAQAEGEAELANYLSQFHSMQAHFTQTIRDARGRVLDQSEGEMALLRPGKFRWETTQPQQQLVIANGSTVWIYDKDLDQVTKQKQQNDNRLSPALLLSANDQRLLQNFNVTQAKSDDFLLKPKKNSDALFARLMLQFNQGKLQGMKMEDKLGQTTLITFSHSKINLPLTEQTFQFTPPKGVDVIDNT